MSLGTGVRAFLLLAFLFDRLSKIALFASVVVLNPVVKWGVYGASYSLGRLLLGPVPGVSIERISPSPGLGVDVLARLWLGNLILATVFAVVGRVGLSRGDRAEQDAGKRARAVFPDDANHADREQKRPGQCSAPAVLVRTGATPHHSVPVRRNRLAVRRPKSAVAIRSS